MTVIHVKMAGNVQWFPLVTRAHALTVGKEASVLSKVNLTFSASTFTLPCLL